ncbi:RagB/SusD family nutrient uptake outer membrane protein [Salinimicrobium oceani]|uniref:RagB/SusD family nutrient uptake outer membrane protein n=1 Tax=Salinimicrobium oceani TaxID=2722702 RepID=A0ABX1D3S2_9FLAO|nr:RagB/SusD family nutrient uptake outer membrane protein [Salinimicrobium oceani]NJW53171.1 RagB/SusD family nutrient uptake outer membrane protein [Salinimicrobium oceani]
MKKYLLITALGALALGSCSSDLDLENKELVSREQINALAESSPEALLVVTEGINDGANAFLRSYSTYGAGAHSDFGLKAIHLGTDLMSNDVVMTRSHWFSEYHNYLGREQQNTRGTATVWNFYYTVIRDVNGIVELIPADTENPELLASLGKALALRGLAYFDLIRLYADGERGIPLYTEDTFIASRAATSQVVTQIGEDLERAYDALEGYNRVNKTQINQDVVAGLLARYYLEYGDYAQAIAMSEQAQSAGSLMSEEQIFDGFDEISNPSWIWGADITPETSSIYASFFSHMANLNAGYAGLLQVYKSVDKRLYDAIPATDARKDWFVGADQVEEFGLPQYANVKFVDDTFFEGDYVYMRVEEMLLIEAEARALSGDDEGAAQALFELVSKRDSSYTLSTKTGDALLEEIRLQRRIELWGEGFAFFDMKRWDMPLVRNYEGTNHAGWAGQHNFAAGSPKFILQIPISEINNNDEIGPGDQNPL